LLSYTGVRRTLNPPLDEQERFHISISLMGMWNSHVQVLILA